MLPRLTRPLKLALLLSCLMPVRLLAQEGATVKWVVDPLNSLVWWQIEPHYGHLWATTCPSDPSWQAGEGRSPGYYVNYDGRPDIKVSKHKASAIPLFPRLRVRPMCRRAVEGEIRAVSAERFEGISGSVRVNPDSITMGADARDVFSRKYIFKPNEHPRIRFVIDSLVQVQPGDTTKAVAVGILHFREAVEHYRVPVAAWREANGLRVVGQWGVAARDMTDKLGMSSIALGAGVTLKLWDALYLGLDLLLVPPPQAAAAPPS